jgi:hypothetical protein
LPFIAVFEEREEDFFTLDLKKGVARKKNSRQKKGLSSRDKEKKGSFISHYFILSIEFPEQMWQQMCVS